MNEWILTSHCSATRGLLTTDLVSLNHGQVMKTTPELVPTSPNYHTTPTEERLSSRQKILLTANHRRLRLQWAHEHRAWQADWHQVVFSNESRFNLWDHDGYIRVRRCAGERCFPECVIERHSDLTLKVMVLGIPGAIFQQDNTRPQAAKIVRDFCSAQHMQLLPWLAYSPDMSPIEHMWIWLVGVSLVFHLLQLQKTNSCCAYNQY
ncbi:transposable element Tc1 transposase [Trichonephila clavipes]|nr:transposable element Tc1 transposase [Trichonephila clavipes]